MGYAGQGPSGGGGGGGFGGYGWGGGGTAAHQTPGSVSDYFEQQKYGYGFAGTMEGDQGRSLFRKMFGLEEGEQQKIAEGMLDRSYGLAGDLSGMYGQAYQRTYDEANVGLQQGLADIETQGERQLASGLRGMEQRGLGGTTLAGKYRESNLAERGAMGGRLRAGYSQLLSGIMERGGKAAIAPLEQAAQYETDFWQRLWDPYLGQQEKKGPSTATQLGMAAASAAIAAFI